MNKLSLFSSIILLLSGCMLSEKRCQKYFEEAKPRQYDIIIVPGYPYENHYWDRIHKGRIHWAKYLLDNGIAKNIMFSGGSVYTPYYEAKAMALYAKHLGVPDSVMYTEIMAEHSTENVYYCYKKAKNLGFESVALATDPFQTKQLKWFLRNTLEGKVDVIPFVIDTLKTLHTDSYKVEITDTLAFNPHFASLSERESFWKRLKGTLGLNINKSYYENGELHD